MKKESAFHASDLWVGAFEVCNAMQDGGLEERSYWSRQVRREGGPHQERKRKKRAWIELEGGPSPTTGTEPVRKYLDFCYF